MRADLIRDLFQHLDSDGSLQVGRCPNETNRTLEEMPLPLGLKRVLQWYWTKSGGEIGGYAIYSVEESLANEDLPNLIVANMLPIGYAANGDPLVVRFNEERCAIGLISHDHFWGDGGDPKAAYAQVTASIEEFLWRAAEGRYLPIDYYVASELWEMRKEIDGNGAV